MADETTTSSGSTTDIAADAADAGSRLDKERKALSETMGAARETVAAQAHALEDRVADRLGAEAESMKEEAVAGLSAFSKALRTASDELSGKDLGLAGDMVRQAAGGLEGLVRAVDGRSPGEMLEGVRAFGRQNPVGFIAGSVLAGFALGRLAAVLPAGTGAVGTPTTNSPARGAAASAGSGHAATVPMGGVGR